MHYNFISRREFEAMIENDELLEWAVYNNRYYGTPAAPIEEVLEDKRDILLEIERIGDELVVSLTDFAPRVDPERVKPRALDDLRPGGLGTHLMRQVMDRVEFEEPPPGCGNLLRMVKRIG